MAVSTHVVSGSAQGKEDEALRPRVHELATHRWSNAHETVWTK